MERLLIRPTQKSPLFEFTTYGFLSIEGSSVSDESDTAYNNAIKWCKDLSVRDIYLTFKLDKVNPNSITKIIDLIETIRGNEYVSSISIDWYFPEYNMEMYDHGEFYKNLFDDTKFDFHVMHPN